MKGVIANESFLKPGINEIRVNIQNGGSFMLQTFRTLNFSAYATQNRQRTTTKKSDSLLKT